MANDAIQYSLLGVDELLGKLDELGQDVRKKGGRFALRKAAKIVEAAAKVNANKVDDPGTGRSIADNIATRFSTRRFKRTGDLLFRVGVSYGAVLPGKGETVDKTVNSPTPHWRLKEFGTSKMRAEPFMRPALSDNIGAATNEFIVQYDKAIDRAIKRAKKKKR